jgi:hypothetical protein
MLAFEDGARWLFLEEKATRLPVFCKEQNRKRRRERCSQENRYPAGSIPAGFVLAVEINGSQS